MTTKIVIVTYGGGHVAMLVPIIKKLQKNNLKLIVLGLTTAGSVLEKNCIPYVGFADLLESDNQYARKWGEKLVNKKTLHKLVSYEESVAYMGLSYVDLELDCGKDQAAKLYEKHGRQAFNPKQTIRRFLKKESPDLLISTNSPRAERASIEVSKELNIPSICLVDLFALQEIKWIGKKEFANKVCVLSSSVKKMLTNAGRNKENVVVTGNPAFDSLMSFEAINTGKDIKKDRGWNDEELTTLLYASQPEPTKHPFSDLRGNPKLPRN